MKKLKLYVWEGVLTDYTSGIMFAMAYSVKEARQLLIKQVGKRRELMYRPKVYKDPAAGHCWGGG